MRTRSTFLSGFRGHILDIALPGPAPAAPAAPAPAAPGSIDFGLPTGGLPPSPRPDVMLHNERSSSIHLDRLPPRARQKLDRLRAVHEDARVVLRDLAERQSRAGERKRTAQAHLDAVSSTPGVIGRRLTPHEIEHKPGIKDAVRRAEADLASATAEHAQLTDRATRLHGRLSPLPDRLTAWVAGLSAGAVVEDYVAPVPKLAPGQTAMQALEEARERLVHLRADLHEIASKPAPSRVVKQRLAQQLDDLASRGAPDPMMAIEVPGQPVKFPNLRVQFPTGLFDTEDAFAFTVWLHRAEIEKRIHADIDSLSDDAHAVTESERNKQSADVLGKILSVEYEEEAIGEAIEAAGGEFVRRVEADPRAVLMVEIR